MSDNKYYDEGKQAFAAGVQFDDNPYESASFNWILGYLSAEQQAKDDTRLAKLAAVQKGAK